MACGVKNSGDIKGNLYGLALRIFKLFSSIRFPSKNSRKVAKCVRLQILFYKRSNHEASFRAVKINHKNLVK